MAKKLIKPDGGGDYADLATWEAWADDQASANQEAECYGGTGDLGEVAIADWTATPDSSNYPWIHAPKAQRHDGTKASSGAWVDVDSATTGIDVQESYTRVEGIRVMMSSTGVGIYVLSSFMGEVTTGQIIDSNLLVVEAAGSPTYAIRAYASAANISCDVRNNIGYNDGSGNHGIEVQAHSPSPPLTVAFNVQNNSFDGFARNIVISEGSYVTGTYTVENNIATNGTTFDFGSAMGSPAVDAYNNSSEDGTADDWDFTAETEFTSGYDCSQSNALGNYSGTYHDKVAMSFQLDNARDVKRVQMYIVKAFTPGDITVRIETDSSGHPSGTLAHANLSGTITEASIGSGWTRCVFTNAGSLSASTTYWLVMSLSADPGSGEYYSHYGNGDGGYANGHFEYHPDGGSWTDFAKGGSPPYQPVDAQFKIEYFTDHDNDINETPSDLFVTEGSDMNLKANASAIDTGKTISGWDHDALHVDADNWRPQWNGWDRGALEKAETESHSDHADIYFRGSSVAYETNKYLTEAKAGELATAVNDAMDAVSDLQFDDVTVMCARNDDTPGS